MTGPRRGSPESIRQLQGKRNRATQKQAARIRQTYGVDPRTGEAVRL